jgi:MFS family permease
VFATTIATPLFTRFVRARQRLALMGPLAVLTCATLVLTALHPNLVVSLAIFSLSAAFGSYQIAANTAFVIRVPTERRSQAFGLANMGVVVGQGAAFVAAGAAVEVISPAAVIAISGATGAVIAIVLTFRWRHVSPPGGRHAARRRSGHAATRKSVPLRGSP